MNLSEIVLVYIQQRFSPSIGLVILQAFGALEQLGLKYYEDKFVDLVQREDDIERDEKQDLFIIFLKQDLLDVIKEHRIPIEVDFDPSISELNEFVNFIYRVQTLEDYSWVTYRLNGDGSPRLQLADIIGQYSLLDKARILSLLGDEVDTFLSVLKSFSDDRIEESTESPDNRFKAHVDRFLRFLDGHSCLGKTLLDKGYQFDTFESLLNILPYQLQDYVSKELANTNHEIKNTATRELQIWLDVISIIMLTKDDYDAPLLKLSKNMYRITGKPDEVIRLTAFANKIVSDFNSYCEANKLLGEQHVDPN